MNSGLARRALAHLDAWTWLVAEYRTWLIVIATVIGMAAPLLGAARKRRPKPAPSLVIRSGAMALAFLAVLIVFEILYRNWRKLPFTCSRLCEAVASR